MPLAGRMIHQHLHTDDPDRVECLIAEQSREMIQLHPSICCLELCTEPIHGGIRLTMCKQCEVFTRTLVTAGGRQVVGTSAQCNY
jgi:hypothetical protein